MPKLKWDSNFNDTSQIINFPLKIFEYPGHPIQLDTGIIKCSNKNYSESKSLFYQKFQKILAFDTYKVDPETSTTFRAKPKIARDL